MRYDHILIVEDEPLILMATGYHLEDEDFRQSSAKNADEAMHILEREQDISAIFTDIDMPGSMDGLRLASVVHERWPSVKIIITSGQRQVEITDIPDGGVFFSKPYDLAVITESIRNLLGNK